MRAPVVARVRVHPVLPGRTPDPTEDLLSGGAAEWNCVEVCGSPAIQSLNERVVSTENYGAVIVVWQTFGIVADLIWIELFVLVVWVLQVLRGSLQSGISRIAPEFGAFVGALIGAGARLEL